MPTSTLNKEETLTSRLAKVLGLSSDLSFPSIIDAIEADHEDIKKCLGVMKSEDASLAQKKKAYKTFAPLLKSHSSAEEKVVYAFCLGIEELKEDSYEGYVEHGIAGNLIRKINGLRDAKQWAAHVKVLAELVEHHIQEEEKEFLPSLRNYVKTEEQRRMREEFVSLRARTQGSRTRENSGVLVA